MQISYEIVSSAHMHQLTVSFKGALPYMDLHVFWPPCYKATHLSAQKICPYYVLCWEKFRLRFLMLKKKIFIVQR